MIHVLSGQITITTANNNSKTFYTRDFFIIPSKLEGNWQSEGHGLTKYLSVKRSW